MPFPLRPVSPGQRVKAPSAYRENVVLAAVRNHQMQRLHPPSVRTGKKRSAFEMSWGTATTDHSGGSNTITLTPSDASGTATGEANVEVYLYLPTNYTVAANSILISSGDVLGYFPFDEGGTPKGVLASVPLNTIVCE